MELVLGTEPTRRFLWMEAGGACRKLLETVMLVQPGENVVITADTSSDERIVDLTASTAYSLGAVPTVVYYPTAPTSTLQPPAPVAAAIQSSDVWIEYAVAYTLYSDAYKAAMASGVRYICLTGMDIEMLVRTVGKVDYLKMIELGHHMCTLLKQSGEVRVLSSSGTDLVFTASHVRDVIQPGRIADKKGEPVMLGGQNGWMVEEGEEVNGTLVFDGACWPPEEIGILKEPIVLAIDAGFIVGVEGGSEARILERWLAAGNHPNSYRMAHVSPGFNPGVTRCSGRIVEDERVFGCIEIGFGKSPSWDAPGHTDGVNLLPTISVNDIVIEKDGIWIDERMRQLCRELNVAGY